MHISIIAVGGTIDKVYFDAKSQYEVGPPNIARVLGELNLAVSYSVTSLMRKDSLDLTDHDRQIIFTAVQDDPAQRILITHGTDTMVQTALRLKAISGKTIVLTGALEPALFKTSDAVFNIGCALAAVESRLCERSVSVKLPPDLTEAARAAVYAHAHYIWYVFTGIGILGFVLLMVFRAVTDAIDRKKAQVTPG